MMVPARRILLASIGSLGDLHPMLALGLELRHRGHRVTVASTPWYSERVRRAGLEFRPLRPDWDPTDRELIAQCEDLKTGPEMLFRKLILPHLRDTYEDLLAMARESDLMIAGELVYAAPLVAEKLNLRWVSAILSPVSFFSAHDPSLLVNIPAVYRLRGAGPWINRAILNFGKRMSRHWWEPVEELRRDLGLRLNCDPVFKDKFSPYLVLALFSKALAESQLDWPNSTQQMGYVFYDGDGSGEFESEGLRRFLVEGEAPIAFTLGSTAVHNPGSFYLASIEAARCLRRRAILVGIRSSDLSHVPSEVLALPYVPYGEVFPHAAVIVHQGGSGTTGQALRAGRPQLIVPYGWDQPDNAARIVRHGAGLSIARSDYNPISAERALRKLLARP